MQVSICEIIGFTIIKKPVVCLKQENFFCIELFLCMNKYIFPQKNINWDCIIMTLVKKNVYKSLNLLQLHSTSLLRLYNSTSLTKGTYSMLDTLINSTP